MPSPCPSHCFFKLYSAINRSTISFLRPYASLLWSARSRLNLSFPHPSTESGEKRRILKPQTHSLVCLMDFTHSFIKTSLVDSFASSVLHVNFLRFSATLTLSHGHCTAQCATCIPLSVLLYIKYIRVLIFGLACVGTRSCFSFLLTLAERRVNGKA